MVFLISPLNFSRWPDFEIQLLYLKKISGCFGQPVSFFLYFFLSAFFTAMTSLPL